ncbi:MAG: FAD-dependent oxidoreductase [Nitrospirota bacterium]
MKYLVIGNGVAGTTAAASIRKIDSTGEIKIISDEPYPFYSRIRLIDFLCGDVDEKGLTIRKDNWYDENKIELILNTSISNIDIGKKEVVTSSGDYLRYDRLLLSTGGLSFVPPVPGVGKKGVFTLRTLNDAIKIREYAGKTGLRVLLIGGGVLGLEAGNSLRKAGNRITVVEFFPRLLPRQMDPEGADILKSQMEKMGFVFHLGARPGEITGDNRAEALILEDGSRLDCEMIIISAGVRPNAGLAKKIGLNVEKGLIVNDRMETGIADIFAAGDLIQHNGVYYGIWPAAEKQGEIAGINMAGGNSVYKGTTISNTLKVAGIDLVSAGDIDAEGVKESIVYKDRENFIYKKIVLENNNIIGTILYGDIKEKKKILGAIENKTHIGGIRKELEQWNLEKI